MEELIQVGSMDHLKATAEQTLPYVQYSIERFMPETLLTAGFILAIVLDLCLRKTSRKRLTGYFALLVLVVVGYFSWQQWIPFDAAKAWEGGRVIFPYSQSFFAPGPDGTGGFLAL